MSAPRLLLLLAACASCAHQGADDSGVDPAAAFSPPDGPGPYRASAMTLEWTDARGQDLVAEVWYPVPLDSDCEVEPYTELPISGSACREAEPATPPEGGFPLVAFSHGNAGIRYQSIFLTEALAQHGYVVVAPDHPYNTLLDFDQDQLGTVAERRPGDITSAVDRVAELSVPPLSEVDPAGAVLGGLADTSRFGMAGHSFGGWTTLAVGGGDIDLAGLRVFCADPANIAIDYDFCGVLDELPDLATDADFAPPDGRVVSNLSMAPAGWYSFAAGAVGEPGGLDPVLPTLVMGGSKDDSESVEDEIQPLYDRLAADASLHGPDALAVLEGAGHYAFTDICLVGDLQPDCAEADGGYIDLDRAHAIIDDLAIAWFGVTLRGDARYQPWLDSAAGDWAEVTWTGG